MWRRCTDEVLRDQVVLVVRKVCVAIPQVLLRRRAMTTIEEAAYWNQMAVKQYELATEQLEVAHQMMRLAKELTRKAVSEEAAA